MPIKVKTLGNGQVFTDNAGKPLAFGKIYIYASSDDKENVMYKSNDKREIVTAQLSAKGNPIVLDKHGKFEGELWVDVDTPYRMVITSADDTDPPTNPIYDIYPMTVMAPIERDKP